jgi:hypothetical protein
MYNVQKVSLINGNSFTGKQNLTLRCLYKILPNITGVPRNFFSGGGLEGSTNSVKDRGQRERGSGGGRPLVRGSIQFANE